MRKIGFVILSVALAALPAGALAQKAGDVFVGGWLTTDTDGSQWAFFVEPPIDGVYLVEAYDHGGSICGDPGSRTPGATGDPEEPLRWGGFGMVDDDGELVFENSGFYCLDPELGPYRVMLSDLDPTIDPEDDGPVTGVETLAHDAETDMLTHGDDPVVFVRIKETDVETLRKRLAKGG